MLAQPRVLARTREVVRAVVELRAPLAPKDVTVTPPEIVYRDAGAGGVNRTKENDQEKETESRVGLR